MRLVQIVEDGERLVAIVEDARLVLLDGLGSVYEMAMEAIETGKTLETLAREKRGRQSLDYETVAREGRLLPPLDHPDPAHFSICGTGLTHLGSAKARDQMNAKLKQAGTSLTDSMKMFRLGVEGGKPRPGQDGVQPEWFYKGDGTIVVAPEDPIPSPAFALDAGEEAEIVGLYIIDAAGSPCRIGFTLGNEFSDHVMERQNYLYLSHSKLRSCSLGPELLLGELPGDIRGEIRVLRDGAPIWREEFLSGEANMTHTVANLEAHHFKYRLFRRPGDVHAHFFGAAVLSHTSGISCREGDVFEIDVPAFGRPLRNPLVLEHAPPSSVRAI
ncbi:MAG: AraD1 family protein [Parvibaculaceae bacterium]